MKFATKIFTIAVTSMSLFFQVAHAEGNQACAVILGKAQSQSSTEVVARNRRTMVQGVKEFNIMASSQSTTVRLTHAEVIHSEFFKQILLDSSARAKKADVDVAYFNQSEISVLSDDQIDQVSMIIFAEMQAQLQETGPAVAKLSDPSLAVKVFTDFSEEEITDVIGETLKLIETKGFMDATTVLNNSISRAKTVAKVEGGLSLAALVTTGVMILTNNEVDLNPYGTEQVASQFIDIGTIGFWGVVSLSVAGIADSARRLWTGTKAAKTKFLKKLLKSHDEAKKRLVHDPDSKVLYIPQGIKERLQVYEEKVNTILAEFRAANPDEEAQNGRTNITGQNFLRYAQDIVDLQEELSRTYFDDFMKWLKVYERHKGTVKDRFEQIREGNVQSTGSHRKIIKFLDKSLTEALEAIILTRALAGGLLEVLGAELSVLQNFDLSKAEGIDMRTAQTSLSSRSQSLSTTFASLSQFFAQLENTHLVIDKLNSQVEALPNVETLAITNQLGATGPLDDDAVTVSDVLQTMDQFEDSVRRLTKER